MQRNGAHAGRILDDIVEKRTHRWRRGRRPALSRGEIRGHDLLLGGHELFHGGQVLLQHRGALVARLRRCKSGGWGLGARGWGFDLCLRQFEICGQACRLDSCS